MSRAAAKKHPAADVPLATLFRALGDGTRLGMLERLAAAEDALCVCDLEGCFDLSQPTVSHHLKVLRDAGLVTCERRGTWVFCAVDPQAAARIAAFAANLGVSLDARRGASVSKDDGVSPSRTPAAACDCNGPKKGKKS